MVDSHAGYGGGGLEVALLDETLAEDAGDAVLFPSRLLHRAAPVVSGARYALVGLVVVWWAVTRLDRLSNWIMNDATA